MPAIAKNELGGIWHSASGKPWRAKFREIQRRSGLPLTEPEPELPEAPPKSAKEQVLAEIRSKKANLAQPVAAVPVNVVELQNSIVNLRAELADVRGKLDHKALMLERLERSKGVAAAQVIANVPTFGEHRSLLDQFTEMPESPEKTKFYQQNRSELAKFITPVQS